MVDEAGVAGEGGFVEIAAVENNRRLHATAHFMEVDAAELAPFRIDRQRVRALDRLQRGCGVHKLRAELFPDPFGRLGIVDLQPRAGG